MHAEVEEDCVRGGRASTTAITELGWIWFATQHIEIFKDGSITALARPGQWDEWATRSGLACGGQQ
jgi:hypothetical protein